MSELAETDIARDVGTKAPSWAAPGEWFIENAAVAVDVCICAGVASNLLPGHDLSDSGKAVRTGCVTCSCHRSEKEGGLLKQESQLLIVSKQV
jgi:hypothetical protein